MGTRTIGATFMITGRGLGAVLEGDAVPPVSGGLSALLLELPGGETMRALAFGERALLRDPQWRERQALLFPSVQRADIPVGSRVLLDADVAEVDCELAVRVAVRLLGPLGVPFQLHVIEHASAQWRHRDSSLGGPLPPTEDEPSRRPSGSARCQREAMDRSIRRRRSELNSALQLTGATPVAEERHVVRRQKVRGSRLAETVTIRVAAAADLPGLCQLAGELVQQHIGYDAGRYQPPADLVDAYAELFAQHVGKPGSVLLVADAGGEPVGYVFGAVEPPSLVALTGRAGWIHDLYVSPSARGLGTGGRLLDAAVTMLRSLGCPGGVLLGVAPQNAAAMALFRRRGFRATLQEMALGPWPVEDAELGAAAAGDA